MKVCVATTSPGGDMVLVANQGLGAVQSVDFTTSTPTVRRYDTFGALGVGYSNGYAYVCAGAYGLRVVNLATGSMFTAPCGNPSAIAISGMFAYVADNVYGLRVLDLSSPGSPVIVDTTNTMGSCLDVRVSGTTLYTADGTSLVNVLSVP